MLLRETHGLVRLDGPQVPEIGLVSDEHDHNVRLGVVSQLLEPALDILKSRMLGNVVDQERPDRAAVVRAGNGTVALLPRRVPNLRLDGLSLGLDGLGGELYANGGLGLEVELVAREAAEEVGLADARVANQHDLEQVVVLFVRAGSHGSVDSVLEDWLV